MRRTIIAIIATSCIAFAGCTDSVVKKAEPPAEVRTLTELTEAAKKGDPTASFELGALYHDGEQGLQKDLVKAKKLLEAAAKGGDERAQFNLGVMYYIGEGVPKNYTLAKKWFDAAIAQGNARAQFNLGAMYYRGEGVKQDFTKAIELFTLSGHQGFNEAAYNLGVIYAKGEGTPRDIGVSYAWLTAAKKYGNPNAEEAIKNIERSLSKKQLRAAKKLSEELLKKIDETPKNNLDQ